jgi:hypothetical protein
MKRIVISLSILLLIVLVVAGGSQSATSPTSHQHRPLNLLPLKLRIKLLISNLLPYSTRRYLCQVG